MIKVENLSKKFGATTVLDGISFEVQQGEVVGFLGPNGAGKTTTMRILTGFLSPSAGNVTINDRDVVEQSLDVRKDIGYLPENNPLYDQLRVYEYLEFIASVKNVLNSKEGVKSVVNQCRLEEKVSAPISELSKGYRQRVGLAAALLGEPDILLLDEPTSGLDPNQALEIRKLIREIGTKKTILFSTHILAEVQVACDRALIIHRGKIVGQGTIEELARQTEGQTKITAIIEGPEEKIGAFLSGLEKVSQVEQIGRQEYVLSVSAEADEVCRQIFHGCVKNGWVLLQMQKSSVSLEEVFRQLTM